MKPLVILACLPLLFLISCSAYVPGFYYLPHPGVVDVPATQPSQLPSAQVLATIVGVRKPDSRANLPLSVEVRLRVENGGPEPIIFDPKSMDLHTGDLVQFGAPIIDPPSPIQLQQGQSAILTVEFPFPGGSFDQLDLSTLHLQWSVQIGNRIVKESQDFRRSYYADYGYDPYWDGYPYPYYYGGPYVGGVVVVHRRW